MDWGETEHEHHQHHDDDHWHRIYSTGGRTPVLSKQRAHLQVVQCERLFAEKNLHFVTLLNSNAYKMGWDMVHTLTLQQQNTYCPFLVAHGNRLECTVFPHNVPTVRVRVVDFQGRIWFMLSVSIRSDHVFHNSIRKHDAFKTRRTQDKKRRRQR